MAVALAVAVEFGQEKREPVEDQVLPSYPPLSPSPAHSLTSLEQAACTSRGGWGWTWGQCNHPL